jgi:hypothetical protein
MSDAAGTGSNATPAGGASVPGYFAARAVRHGLRPSKEEVEVRSVIDEK